MSEIKELLTGVILAGGRARRMNSKDKGLISLAGKPMIEYVIEAMIPQVDELLINANRNCKRYKQYGFAVIPDKLLDFSGPLAGIAAALERASNKLLFTVPCDSPWLPTDLCTRLYKRLIDSDADVCVVHDGERLQPVFGLFHGRVLPGIQDYLAAGNHKIRLWLEKQRFAIEDFSDDPSAFFNVNTPAEQARMEALLKGAGN